MATSAGPIMPDNSARKPLTRETGITVEFYMLSKLFMSNQRCEIHDDALQGWAGKFGKVDEAQVLRDPICGQPRSSTGRKS